MNVSGNMESPTLRIQLSDLRKITNKLFDHIIETRGEKELVVDRSFYWEISFDELFDMEKKPQDLSIGSLEDDWDFLSRVLDEDELLVARQFTELATLFRFIGETIGEKLAPEGG